MKVGPVDDGLDGATDQPAATDVAVERRDGQQGEWGDAAANVVRRVRGLQPVTLGVLLVVAAYWGIVVDASLIPVLQPTGSSTIFQASTSAVFAVLGIFFGPLVGALGGLIRDGTPFVLTLILHPDIVTHHDFLRWFGNEVMDILEDVVLGWVPGLVAVRTRRLSTLAFAAAVTTWLSLPLRTVGDMLINGQAGQIWSALTTKVGDWNQPADPALTVYALVTGAMVALGLAWWTSRPRLSLLIGVAYCAGAAALIALGAHP
jgi:hypothetical protein